MSLVLAGERRRPARYTLARQKTPRCILYSMSVALCRFFPRPCSCCMLSRRNMQHMAHVIGVGASLYVMSAIAARCVSPSALLPEGR